MIQRLPTCPIPPGTPMSFSAAATTDMSGFDFDPRTRVIYSPGCLSQLGSLAAELGGRRVLLVTDAGLRAAGHESRALEFLSAARLDVHVYDEVQPNPTTADVERCTEFARRHDIDLIIGLGGGSSMDCAKGTNFLLTNGGRMQDYRGIGKATKPMLPLIAVPTTAGTGSEAQSFAVIADAETHLKMACGDKKAAARVALLDPELTLTMPRQVTAVTGIDAISHAVESYVSTKRNLVSQLFSRRAWSLLNGAFETVLSAPDNLEARGDMLLGAHFAGAAIENAMLGATHALANPLTAEFDLPHGIAIGLMLPHVVRYNAAHVGTAYQELVSDAGLNGMGAVECADLLARRIVQLVLAAGQPTNLAECGVTAADLSGMAASAAEQWTGLFNPRSVDAAALLELYRCALNFDAATS